MILFFGALSYSPSHTQYLCVPHIIRTHFLFLALTLPCFDKLSKQFLSVEY